MNDNASTPKPRIDAPTPKPEAQEHKGAPAPHKPQGAPHGGSEPHKNDVKHSVPKTARDIIEGVKGWVSKTFPGNENTFWFAILGIILAIFVIQIGILKTLFFAIVVLIFVEIGRRFDGKSSLANKVNHGDKRSH